MHANEARIITNLFECDILILLIQEAPQLAASARMFQLPQGFRFDLPNPFACDRELLTDFFERMVRIHPDAETHPKDTFFARGQRR